MSGPSLSRPLRDRKVRDAVQKIQLCRRADQIQREYGMRLSAAPSAQENRSPDAHVRSSNAGFPACRSAGVTKWRPWSEVCKLLDLAGKSRGLRVRLALRRGLDIT